MRVEALEGRVVLSGAPPRAVADFYNLNGAASLSVAAAGVLANDTDAENDPLSAAVARGPSFGSLALNANGSFTYTPTGSFTHWDSFEYVVADGTSAGNRAIVTITNGQPAVDDDDGENTHPHGTPAHDEHEAVFNLMPRYTATHTAVASGGWSSAATWSGGVVPAADARVLIPAGMTVTVDGELTTPLAIVRVEGGLRFDPTRNTRLRAETVLVYPTGTFEMGTAANPIPQGTTARLMFVDRGEISRTWDPLSLSRGLIAHGTTSIYGTAATAFRTLQTAPATGATTLTLDAAPTNWRVGDQIVIAGTSRMASENNESEVRTILAISGATIMIAPLTHNHFSPEPAAKVHVAHVTRNAVFESENAALDRRGHVMFMHSPAVTIQNAAFNQLGRTNKLVAVNDSVLAADGSLTPGTGTNQRGRYAVHFHRTGAVATGPAATVGGSVVFDSPGWGYVNHSSYVHFTDNVAYDVNGAAFVTEAGDEIGSYRRNIAIHSTGSDAGVEARRSVNDFGHEGDGFWFQGGGIEVENNVSAAQDKHGFIFFTEGLIQEGGVRTRFTSANLANPAIAAGATTISVGSVPIRLFRGNTAYGTSQGIQTQFHLQTPTHTARSTLEDMLVWNSDIALQIPYTKQTNLRNARLLGNMTNPLDYGIDGNSVTENILAENIYAAGFDIGWEIPRRGDNVLTGGTFENVVNFELIKTRMEPRTFTTAGALDLRMLPAPTGSGMTATNFRVEQSLIDDGGYMHVFRPDGVTLMHADCTGQHVYSSQQTASFVPFPTALANLAPEYVGKTNQQLFDQYGLAVGGSIAPATATTAPGVIGLADPTFCGLHAPVAMDNSYTLWQGVSWAESANTGVLNNDYDMDGQPLSAVLQTPPANGTVTLNADGSFTYLPNAAFVGTDTFTYSVNDGTATSTTPATVTLTVQPTDPNFLVTTKEVATGRALTTIDLATNAPLFIDADITPEEFDDNVAFFSAGLTGGKVLRTAKADRTFGLTGVHDDDEAYVRFHLNQNATVYVAYSPNLIELPEWLDEEHGWRPSAERLRSMDHDYVLFEQTFTAGDVSLGHNVAHDATTTSTPGMYTVVITTIGSTPVNNAPHAARDLYDLAGQPSLTVAAATGVLANDLDNENDLLTATVTRAPLFGTLALAADGSFVYSRGPNFTRWDSFEYTVADGLETGNPTLVTLINGQTLEDLGDPHQGDEVRHDEHIALLELIAHHTATHTAVASGDWSSPATWEGGRLPIDHANVRILPGLTVTVSGDIAPTLRTVRIDGTLRFATNVHTVLRSDTTIVTPSGRFEMGTTAAPIAPGVTARLIVADRGPLDRVWDPFGLSRGLISHGTTSIRGTTSTAFLPLAVAPRIGDTQLVLAGVPINWRVGDEIVVAGVGVNAATNNESELRTITAIAGNVVTIAPLAFNHVPPANSYGFQVHVAHLTRNAIVESQNANIASRGHVMFMHNDAVDIDGVAMNHIGRTDKRVAANDPIVVHDGVLVPGRGDNPRGRYAAHFHRTGITNDGSPGRVRNSVVRDSLGWGYVNHSSFIEFTDNVAYDVDGASFVTETGDEIGTFARNIAIHGIGSGAGLEDRIDIQDFGHQGDGFWFQGGGVHVTDNVAAAQRAQGFIFFTEGLVQPGLGTTRFLSANLPNPAIANGATTLNVINTPIFEFRGNTTYGSVDGLHTQYHLLSAQHTARSVIADFTAWNVSNGHNAPYTKHTDVVDLLVFNDVSAPRSEGFNSNDVTEDITWLNPTIIGFVDGIEVPQRGHNRLIGGVLHNRNNIEMDILRRSYRSLTISGGTEFRLIPPPATGASYNLQLQQVLTPYEEQGFAHVFYSDALYIDNGGGNVQQVWSPEQAPSFVPFPTAHPDLPPEYVGLTNQQLFDQFGLAVGGQLAPATAITIPSVRGLLTTIPYFVDTPQPSADYYWAAADTPRSIPIATGVLVNDVDPVIPMLSATLLSPPAHGSVSLAANGSFTYTPNAGYTGPDSFTYRATNGVNPSAPATVSLNVLSDPNVAVTSVSTNKAYQAIDLAVGAVTFIDRTYVVTSFSPGLEGGTLIQTANDDKAVTAASHLTLSAAQPVTVYVGYDRRNTVRPAWLAAANGWTASAETLSTDYSAGNPTYVLYQKDYAAGSIVLGGPGQGAPVTSGSHYVAVVTPRVSPGDVNGDRQTTRADLLALVRNLGQSTSSQRTAGDLNGDGRTGLLDLVLVQSNLRTPASPAAPIAAAAVDAVSAELASETPGNTAVAATRRTVAARRPVGVEVPTTTSAPLRARRAPARASLHDAALT